MRILIVFFVAAIVAVFFAFDLNDFLTLENLKLNHAWLTNRYLEHPLQLSSLFALAYILMTAISLPGAALMTIAAGAIFGLSVGTLLVSFASSIGATLAFVVARFVLRDFVQKRFRARARAINAGIEKEGAFYLFTLRLVPLFPFFLVNLAMGLTRIKISIFYIVSQIGMLPGTLIFVNAGTQLGNIESIDQIFSARIFFSFLLLGIFPLVSKISLEGFRRQKYSRRFEKPKKFDYNLLVIGAGSGGLVAAYIAAALKARVGLIEKAEMGGDCLNTGCVPSKAFLRAAKAAHDLRHASRFGFESVEPRFQFTEVMEKVRQAVTTIAPHDSIERYTKLGVECISGEARLLSPFEVSVNNKVLTAKNIVLATGAAPSVPPLPGLDKINYLTSENIWELRELPKRLVILGGGPIGCELAQGFARLGSVVTIVEKGPRLMSREDPEVGEKIQAVLTEEGVRVVCRFKAIRVDGERQVLHGESEQGVPPIAFDRIVVALGRKARIKGFGLEELDLEITRQGTIAVDEYMRTTRYPSIFVCGDAAGPFQFTHVASHQAWFAAVNSLFGGLRKFKVDYGVIPWCTFTAPEVARVGLNETEASEKDVPFRTYRYDLSQLDRAITEGDAQGFIKVLVTPGTDEILGVTIVGAHAGETICEFVTAMKHGLGLNKVLNTIHIYPTMAEANKYVAGAWKRENAPAKVLSFLRRYHEWRRS